MANVLKILILLSTDAPQIIAWLLQGYELLKKYLPATVGTRSLVKPTALHKKALAILNKHAPSGTRGLFDFGFLQGFADFLERSGLLAVLMLLFSRPQV